MGRAYDKQYHFGWSGGSCGTMICAKCGKAILHSLRHDWMSSKKDCKDDAGWPDWKYVCFHMQCVDDQSGWEKIEKDTARRKAKHDANISKLKEVAADIGITDPIEFAHIAADALGEDDLDGYYFREYGSG